MQTPVVTKSSTVYIASQYSVSRNLLHIFPSFHLQNDPALPDGLYPRILFLAGGYCIDWLPSKT